MVKSADGIGELDQGNNPISGLNHWIGDRDEFWHVQRAGASGGGGFFREGKPLALRKPKGQCRMHRRSFGCEKAMGARIVAPQLRLFTSKSRSMHSSTRDLDHPTRLVEADFLNGSVFC